MSNNPYTTFYKKHFACFVCRKMFRSRAHSIFHDPHGDEPVKCPQCAHPMSNMGWSFKPPPQKDEKAWRKIQMLFERGVRWWGHRW